MADRNNPFAKQWRQFKASTSDHQLTVLHDDGPYRHLRMKEPGADIWSWNVVTWPGYLTITGDIGSGFTFVREDDMLAFFDTRGYGDWYGDGSPMLLADYWAEKLTRACRDAAWSYDGSLVRRHINEHLTDLGVGGAELAELMQESLVYTGTEEEARGWLASTEPFRDADTWEWHYRSLDHHYLLACYAIATTIRAYFALRRTALMNDLDTCIRLGVFHG